jgi:hypothetical protein
MSFHKEDRIGDHPTEPLNADDACSLNEHEDRHDSECTLSVVAENDFDP